MVKMYTQSSATIVTRTTSCNFGFLERNSDKRNLKTSIISGQKSCQNQAKKTGQTLTFLLITQPTFAKSKLKAFDMISRPPGLNAQVLRRVNSPNTSPRARPVQKRSEITERPLVVLYARSAVDQALAAADPHGHVAAVRAKFA